MTHSPKTSLKKTNIPWIWEIPEDWEVKKLKFVFKYVTGGTPDSWKGSYYDENGYNWITISDMSGRYTGESKNKISALAIKEKNMRIVPRWSLLYSFKLSVWQLAFVSEDTYTNEAILAILPRDWLNLDFWYYALQSYFDSNANENIYGAKIFNQFSIDNGLIISPPLLIQSTIAHFLDAKTEKISTLISNKKKLIDLLKEQKQSIIHQAVTKGIDKNAKMKDSEIPWIWEIPEDWEILKLKYTGKIINWSTPSSSEKDYWDWDIDWITPTDLGNSDDPNLYQSGRKITKLWLENCGTTIVPKNSIILSCRAPIWSLGITTKDMCTNQGCKAFIVNSRVIYQYVYFHFIAYNEYLQSLWKWTTFQELSTTEFENSYFILPSIITQESIVEYIKKEAFQIDSAIYKIEQEITLIEEYRTSLIYQAVTGKLSIS